MKDELQSHYTFEYDADCDCAIVSWHGRVPDDKLREINLRFLEFVKENRVKKMIQDVLIVSELSKEYQEWLSDEYIPQLHAAGIQYSAVVMPIRPLDSMDLELVVDQVKSQSIEMRYFSILSAAKNWLRSV